MFKTLLIKAINFLFGKLIAELVLQKTENFLSGKTLSEIYKELHQIVTTYNLAYLDLPYRNTLRANLDIMKNYDPKTAALLEKARSAGSRLATSSPKPSEPIEPEEYRKLIDELRERLARRIVHPFRKD